jgi:hypothetical protein
MSSESASSKNTSPIKAKDAKEAIASRADPNKLEAQEEKATAVSGEAETHLSGLKTFYTLRKKWSWFILGCISVLLIFHISLAYLVGLGYLDFKDYNWFLPIVATNNFLQIIALAIIVVKFLFSDPRPSQSPVPRRQRRYP